MKKPIITEKEMSLANKIIAIGATVAVVAALLLLRHCHKTDSQIIVLPAVSGKFEAVKPKHEPITENTPQFKKPVGAKNNPADNKEKEMLLKLLAENERLKSDFTKANDSLKQVIYAQAIQLNDYTETFTDDNITATISGVVRGEIQSVKLDYKVKERIINMPIQKETKLRILAGVEAGNSIMFNDFALRANLMLQGKQGNVITTSFDTGQRIWVGYNFSILNIKR